MASGIVEAIQRVSGFADQKEDPIAGWTSAVWFEKGGVYAVNSRMGARADLEDNEIIGGVGATALTKAIRAVGGEFESVRQDKTNLVLEGSGAVARLPLRPQADAPTFPRPEKLKWVGVEGLSGVNRAAWCAGDSDRPHLDGVWLDFSGLCATNGYAAVQIALDGVKAALKALGRNEAIMVQPAVFLDLPAVAWLAMEPKGNRLFISGDSEGKDWVRMASLPAHTMPPLEKVMVAGKGSFQLRVGREAGAAVVKRARLARNIGVLEFDPKHPEILSVKSPDMATHDSLFDLSARIPVEVSSGEPTAMAVGIDLTLLLPALEKACTGDFIDLRIGPTGLDPIMIESHGAMVVIMPWRM